MTLVISIVGIEEQQMLDSNKMKEYCLNIGDDIEFTTSQEGLNGECGITNPTYNEEKGCYIFYTYGEERNGTDVAISTINILEKKPTTINIFVFEIKPQLLEIVRNILLFIALVCTIAAIWKGFRWGKKENEV